MIRWWSEVLRKLVGGGIGGELKGDAKRASRYMS